MGTVNKDALVKAAAEQSGLPTTSARAAIDAFLGVVAARAEAGDTVRLSGFGTFQVKARSARMGRNPQTGEAVSIPESRKLVFKAPKST